MSIDAMFHARETRIAPSSPSSCFVWDEGYVKKLVSRYCPPSLRHPSLRSFLLNNNLSTGDATARANHLEGWGMTHSRHPIKREQFITKLTKSNWTKLVWYGFNQSLNKLIEIINDALSPLVIFQIIFKFYIWYNKLAHTWRLITNLLWKITWNKESFQSFVT